MKTYRDTGIKEIITEFPQVEEILDEYGIGCGPCTVGICLLKDIVDIHKMGPEKEQEMMGRIEAAIYPERNAHLDSSAENKYQPGAPHLFSAPMQVLVDEHAVIKRLLAVIPAVVETIDLSTDEGRQVIIGGIEREKRFSEEGWRKMRG